MSTGASSGSSPFVRLQHLQHCSVHDLAHPFQHVHRTGVRAARGRWQSAAMGSSSPQGAEYKGINTSTLPSRNLGEIQGMLLRDSSQVPAEMQAMHQMSTQAYQGGIVVDGFAIFGSLTLFAVMIALSFGRVLGVDQFMARMVRETREERRDREQRDILNARRNLEQRYDEDR